MIRIAILAAALFGLFAAAANAQSLTRYVTHAGFGFTCIQTASPARPDPAWSADARGWAQCQAYDSTLRTRAGAQPSAPARTQASTTTTPRTLILHPTCASAEAANVPRRVGSKGPGRGFPVEQMLPARQGGPRDRDGDGVVCEE